MKKFKIKVGDTVRYSQNFGSGPVAVAVVQGIEKCAEGEKYGAEVDAITNEEHGTLDLSDGLWAYVRQVKAVVRK
jgi:hypothetical protein